MHKLVFHRGKHNGERGERYKYTHRHKIPGLQESWPTMVKGHDAILFSLTKQIYVNLNQEILLVKSLRTRWTQHWSYHQAEFPPIV